MAKLNKRLKFRCPTISILLNCHYQCVLNEGHKEECDYEVDANYLFKLLCKLEDHVRAKIQDIKPDGWYTMPEKKKRGFWR